MKEIKIGFPDLSDEELKTKLPEEDKNVLDNPIPEPFQGEGLENLAKKAGKPIAKVTIYEKKDESSKFGKRYVEVDAGSNVYFVMYENQQTKERSDFRSIATHKAIEKIVKGDKIAEDKDGFDKIILSPGDLVYVPTKEEQDGIKAIDWNDKRNVQHRIYKVVSFTKKDLQCINSTISDYIIPYNRKEKSKGEIGWDNKSAITMEEDETIKEICIKLKVDRLGNISKA